MGIFVIRRYFGVRQPRGQRLSRWAIFVEQETANKEPKYRREKRMQMRKSKINAFFALGRLERKIL